MVQQAFSKDTGNKVLQSVKIGMEVYDSQEHRLGKVEDMYAGASSPTANARGTGAATAPAQDTGNDKLFDQIAQAFASDNLPEELRQRLLHDGYLRIGGDGLFGRARYVLPDQVSSVSGDRVVLRVNRDELIKR